MAGSRIRERWTAWMGKLESELEKAEQKVTNSGWLWVIFALISAFGILMYVDIASVNQKQKGAFLLYYLVTLLILWDSYFAFIYLCGKALPRFNALADAYCPPSPGNPEKRPNPIIKILVHLLIWGLSIGLPIYVVTKADVRFPAIETLYAIILLSCSFLFALYAFASLVRIILALARALRRDFTKYVKAFPAATGFFCDTKIILYRGTLFFGSVGLLTVLLAFSHILIYVVQNKTLKLTEGLDALFIEVLKVLNMGYLTVAWILLIAIGVGGMFFFMYYPRKLIRDKISVLKTQSIETNAESLEEKDYLGMQRIYESPDDFGGKGRISQIVAIFTALAALLVPLLGLISILVNSSRN